MGMKRIRLISILIVAGTLFGCGGGGDNPPAATPAPTPAATPTPGPTATPRPTSDPESAWTIRPDTVIMPPILHGHKSNPLRTWDINTSCRNNQCTFSYDDGTLDLYRGQHKGKDATFSINEIIMRWYPIVRIPDKSRYPGLGSQVPVYDFYDISDQNPPLNNVDELYSRYQNLRFGGKRPFVEASRLGRGEYSGFLVTSAGWWLQDRNKPQPNFGFVQPAISFGIASTTNPAIGATWTGIAAAYGIYGKINQLGTLVDDSSILYGSITLTYDSSGINATIPYFVRERSHAVPFSPGVGGPRLPGLSWTAIPVSGNGYKGENASKQTIEGKFYGPNGAETGGVFNDPSRRLVGAFVAK